MLDPHPRSSVPSRISKPASGGLGGAANKRATASAGSVGLPVCTPRMSSAASAPARKGSSPMYSAFRPLNGVRARLIPGASTGRGLGLEFLRHIERCSVIVHVVDCATLEPGRDPLTDLQVIESELALYFLPWYRRLATARLDDHGVVKVLPKLAPLIQVELDGLLLALRVNDKLNAF